MALIFGSGPGFVLRGGRRSEILCVVAVFPLNASGAATSKSEIRYEGTLFEIDTKNSSVTLQNGACLRLRLRLPCRSRCAEHTHTALVYLPAVINNSAGPV